MRSVFSAPALMLSAVLAVVAPSAALAQDTGRWPERPITMIVGYSPGGATDIAARLVATHLSQSLGQSVVVENKPGGGSNIATDTASRAKPDGYTLLVASIANASNQAVYRNLKFDFVRDFAPVALLTSSPSILTVSPSLPVENLKALIALAKAEAGKLTFASSGVGGSPHLAGEMLKQRAQIDMIHVPYKGASQALVDVMAGTVSMGFKTSTGALPFIKKGGLRAIAVASAHRMAELPDVPTIAEAGLPDFEVISWNGIVAPSGTPDAIVTRLNAEVNRILQLPEVRKQIHDLGAEPGKGTAGQFGDYIKAEAAKWRAVVQAANVSID